MDFSQPLIQGVLIKRYSRFLADVKLASGEVITAHTANTGAMSGCSEPGSTVWLSVSDNPKRKYAHTWEIIEVKTAQGIVPVGINTLLSNKLAKEAIEKGVIKELNGYQQLRREVRYGEENSRIDLLLENPELSQTEPDCYVEVKNVTLVENNVAYFPDAVSARGSRHLRELIGVVKQGCRAVMLFCVQRGDACKVRPADHIDPEYGLLLRKAYLEGVEVLAYRADVSSESIVVDKQIPVELPGGNI